MADVAAACGLAFLPPGVEPSDLFLGLWVNLPRLHAARALRELHAARAASNPGADLEALERMAGLPEHEVVTGSVERWSADQLRRRGAAEG